jgi:FkbM family methyltransferase
MDSIPAAIRVLPESRLAQLTDTGVAHTLIFEYFRTLPVPGRPRRLLDVGAAAGGIAEPFLRHGWTVDLVEPDRAWFEHLGRLVATAPAQARLHPLAIAVQDGTIPFTRNKIPGLSGERPSPFGTTVETTTVNAIRFDTLLGQLGDPPIDFLKIDTEGSDFEILETFPFQLQSPPIIFVEFSFYFPSQTCRVVREAVGKMSARGYRAVIFDYDDFGNFHRGNWHHRLVAIHTGDLPERENSFGNVLFYPAGDSHLPDLLRKMIEIFS